MQRGSTSRLPRSSRLHATQRTAPSARWLRGVVVTPDAVVGPGAGSETGFSIAICTHNGAQRLPAVLNALALLEDPHVPTEVIVIDNASADETQAAAEEWSDELPELRVVHERRLGLSFARARAFEEARYEFVVFIDDDNLPRRDWLRVALATMSRSPRIVAAGGVAHGIWPPDTEPSFFSENQHLFACGPQADTRGPLDEGGAFLRGAGLVVRRSAWFRLIEAGFSPKLLDRQGAEVSSSGDVELSLALRLAGGTLYYEPDLVMDHVMTAARANPDYLRSLQRGNGAASVTLDAYWAALGLQRRGNWIRRSLHTARGLCGRIVRRPSRRFDAAEDLEIAYAVGRLRALLRLRSASDQHAAAMLDSGWRGSFFADKCQSALPPS